MQDLLTGYNLATKSLCALVTSMQVISRCAPWSLSRKTTPFFFRRQSVNIHEMLDLLHVIVPVDESEL